MRDPNAPQPRRLVLSGVEIELLCRRTQVTLPPGFGTGAEAAETALRAAEALARRGVVEPAESGDPLECAVHPSVLANLSILARPRVLLRTEVSLGDSGSRAVHAVSGPLGASLFALADDAVELSMFAARDLGRELVRAVPPVAAEAGQGRGIVDILSGPSGPAAPPHGRLPLAALENVGPALAFGGAAGAERAGAELGLSPEELALAREVTARTTGMLRCLVVGPSGDQDTDDLLVGQVVWFATDAGWIGLEPDPAERRMVRLAPVAREDIGTWVAPYVAEVLG
ncbi:hypothetical protein TH66_20540 [Carbonactinospora thermoautotrophica]|uniref:EspG family protein n=2 Tax=Carbonactinospora thermoautotrophica TaxID=1469144 RepID=A0A132ML22_9ACTN|nr:hypothetical protein [Carbonactinospora thermoautotrophica]KWW97827.1 hypothetical protein TH66_20540 [Carbonactinospora thermoautotrophica]KWW98439.1 hypothetical protein LI90_59 [Carbonactinospora thermoautotrophica]